MLRSKLLVIILLSIIGIGCAQQEFISSFNDPEQEIDNQTELRQVIQNTHSKVIASIALSPDGKQLLSGSLDHTLKLWDMATGLEIRTFSGHSDEIRAVAFSPDGKLILSGSQNGALKLWDVETGQEIRTFVGKYSLGISSVAFSPGGKQILSGSHDLVTLWDAATGQEIRTFRDKTFTTELISSTAFAFAGKQVISVGVYGSITLWDVATGQNLQKFKISRRLDSPIAFSPDGKQILSGTTTDNSFKLWDVVSGQELRTFTGHTGKVISFDFSPDGRHILSGSQDLTLKLWDAETGQEIRTLTKHRYTPLLMKFTPDGKRIITVDVTTVFDVAQRGRLTPGLTLWNVDTGELIWTLPVFSNRVQSVAFSPNGKLILSGGDTLNLWDAISGQRIQTFTGHPDLVNSVAFSPDGKQILSGSKDNTIRLWDMAIGQEIWNSEKIGRATQSFVSGSEEPIAKALSSSTPLPFSPHLVAFLPNGKQMLTLDGDTIPKLRDVVTGQVIRTYSEHPLIESIALSPDGKQFVAGGRPFTLLDMATGQELRTFAENSHGISGWGQILAFAPDGKMVLSVTGPDLELWNVSTGKIFRTVTGPYTSHDPNEVTSVAFSPDGKEFLAVNRDAVLRLWDVATGQVIRTFKGHSGTVNSIAFSPDGKQILSGSTDGTTRIWDTASGQLVIIMLSTLSGEWSVNTPDGYYDTSPEGKSLVHYASSRRAYSFEQFESLFHRPDIIKARLAGNLQAGDPAPQLSIPPSVKVIETRSSSATADSATYPLTVVASSPASTVKTVRVFVNGKATNEQSVEAREKRLDLQIPLFAGPNHIAVLAYDERGFSSRPESFNVVSKVSGRKPTLYVMGIGVDIYPNLPGKNLEYAVSDVKRLIQALRVEKGKVFADVKDLILTNQEATQEAIQKGLEALTAMDTNDVAVIFLAGHGTRDQKTGKFWLVTSQGSADNLRQGGLNWDILDQYISKMQGRVILLLDSCHSGSIVDTTVVPNNELAARFFKGQAGGVMVFSAAKGRQLAKEGSQFGGGLFTYALTQGLGSAAREVDRENKGYVSFMDLVDYVSKYVNEETHGQQTPWLSRRELFGDLPIGAY